MEKKVTGRELYEKKIAWAKASTMVPESFRQIEEMDLEELSLLMNYNDRFYFRALPLLNNVVMGFVECMCEDETAENIHELAGVNDIYELLETEYFGSDPANIRREFISTLRCVILG